MKKLFIIFVLITIAIFSYMGCTLPYKTYSYQEKILSFYINEDGNKFVMIGEKYHYICTINNEDDSAFFKAQKLLQYGVNKLTLDILRQNNNELSVSIHPIFTQNELTQEQRAWLDSHGFHQVTYENKTDYVKDILFSGKNYLSNNEINSKIISLTHPYLTTVTEDSDKIVTPLTSPLIYQDMQLELNDNILSPLFKD